MEGFLDRTQLAVKFRVSVYTIDSWLASGILPAATHRRGRCRLWRAEDVDESKINRVRPIGENRVVSPTPKSAEAR
jgi:predicted site-specific integrase-resolvase